MLCYFYVVKINPRYIFLLLLFWFLYLLQLMCVLVPMAPLDVPLLGFEVFEDDQTMETLQTLMLIYNTIT